MNTKFKRILRDQRVLLALVIALLVLVVSIINPRFVRLNNIVAIFTQISVLGVLTMAMAMLLISGGIDLSIGSMMALCGIVVATVLKSGQGMLVALLAGFGTGLVCGAFNGVIIAKSKGMPLIISLGTSMIFNGISLLIAGGAFLQFQNKLDFLRTIRLFDVVPLMVLFMLAVCVIMYVLLNKTKFGRRIVAIGGNEKNAYLSGINVDLYKVITYAIAGVIVAGASLILGARLNSITATAGDGYETDALRGRRGWRRDVRRRPRHHFRRLPRLPAHRHHLQRHGYTRRARLCEDRDHRRNHRGRCGHEQHGQAAQESLRLRFRARPFGGRFLSKRRRKYENSREFLHLWTGRGPARSLRTGQGRRL